MKRLIIIPIVTAISLGSSFFFPKKALADCKNLGSATGTGTCPYGEGCHQRPDNTWTECIILDEETCPASGVCTEDECTNGKCIYEVYWSEDCGTCPEQEFCRQNKDGECRRVNNCASGLCCMAIPPGGWIDCGSECCCDLTCMETYEPPIEPTPTPDISRELCTAQGGFCIDSKECETSLPRPDGDWQEVPCRKENGGTCCSMKQFLTTGCETAGDCHRDYIGCSYWEVTRTKEWSQTFYNRAAAQQWLDNFNTTSDYSFDGTVTLKEITFPIKGELEKFAGVFPYGDPDSDGPAPEVIKGPGDLENYDFEPGPLLELAPPEDAAEIANWLPAMFRNYKQFAVRLKYCGNSRTPDDDDTAVDPNNPDVGWPEIRGAVRYPWGLKQSMFNKTLDNGLWAWLTRRPNQTEAEAINEAKSIAVNLKSGKSLAKNTTNNKVAASEPPSKPNYYIILTQANNYKALGAVLGKITCPEVNPCPDDYRNAPQYDEDCIWYNGETVMTSTFEDIQITKDNSDTRIDAETPAYNAHLSHTESIEMNAEVRECDLAEHWPLKLHLFLNFLPPEELLGSASKAPLTTTPEYTWGKMELEHSDPGIQILPPDDRLGKEITYLHVSGWAKTAEELVMGFRDPKGIMRGYTHPPSTETFMDFARSRPINTTLINEIPNTPSTDAVTLAKQTARWANQKFGAGAGDCSIYLALTAGETGFGKNCGTCNAWQEYAKHPALNTTAERNALRALIQIWKEADIRAQNPLAAKYIPENYAPEGVIGSCGGGALGISQFIPTTALRNLDDVGKPFDLWEPQTAMRAMAAELYKLGWRKGLSHAEKKEVLMKWNATDWWIEKMISTAEQYEEYCQ